MTIRSLFAAATLSLGLALAPAAFAQDAMGKGDGMGKPDSKMSSPMSSPMSKDTKDTSPMAPTTGQSGTGMSKDGMSDTKTDTSGGMKK